MNLLRMAWRFLWSRPFVTGLTVFSVAVGTALVITVLKLRQDSRQSFRREAGLVHLVAGPEGSRLQLVLDALYQLDNAVGTMPFETVETLRQQEIVRVAVPLASGDSIRGLRVVGADLKALRQLRAADESLLLQLAAGRAPEKEFEAMLGADAARQLGFSIGSEFQAAHGIGGPVHEDTCEVVGILKESETAFDRVVWTSLESVWSVHGHAHEQDHTHEHHHDCGHQITAVLLQLKQVGPAMMQFVEHQDEKPGVMIAHPLSEMHRLFQRLLGPVENVLLVLAALVMFAAALTVLATLLQAGELRRRDRAVLRVVGAGRFELFVLVLLEALWVMCLGVALGWLLAHGGLNFWQEALQAKWGIRLQAWNVSEAEARGMLLILLTGLLAGVVPAWQQYRRSPVRDLRHSA